MSVLTKNQSAEQNDPTRLRQCLMCGHKFQSTGPGNRICKKCKSTQTWRQG
jgi:hypothetical protein